MADTRTSPPRRAVSSSGTRLPSTRERRPALAALAVLLIVGGAFASGFLALQAGNRADYLRISGEVAQGAEITEAQLETVSLPEDMEGAISVDDKDDVVGMRAVTHLLPGTILTDVMVTDEAAIEEGTESVAFGLEADTFDPSLDEGAAIAVYANPDDEGAQPDRYEATLVFVDVPEEGSGIGGEGGGSLVQVKVLMDAEDAAAIQPAILDDRVSITEIAPPPPITSDSSGGE